MQNGLIMRLPHGCATYPCGAPVAPLPTSFGHKFLFSLEKKEEFQDFLSLSRGGTRAGSLLLSAERLHWGYFPLGGGNRILHHHKHSHHHGNHHLHQPLH